MSAHDPKLTCPPWRDRCRSEGHRLKCSTNETCSAPRTTRRIPMLFGGDFSFANFLTDVLAVFVFVVWFWLLITVYADLFRRHDISGWGKALWVIVVLVAPYI